MRGRDDMKNNKRNINGVSSNNDNRNNNIIETRIFTLFEYSRSLYI